MEKATKNRKSLGEELVTALRASLANKSHGRIVRPKINVAQIRQQLKLTQKEFAKTYLINLQTLRNWEQGKRNPDLANIAYINNIQN